MTLSSDHEVNQRLEESMNLASQGDEHAAKDFFEALLNGPLYVAERFQPFQLANVPAYPNEFLNILAVQVSDRVIVPVFSNPALIESWSGHKLNFRKLHSSELFDLVPEDWWLCINPGEVVEKEISPWEIDQLKEGIAGIPAILEDLFPGGLEEILEVQALDENEYTDLKKHLVEFATKKPEIAKLFMLMETSRDIDENIQQTLLIGVQAQVKDADDIERVKADVRSVVDVLMIGRSEKIKVLVGSNTEDNLLLGVFNKARPFYENKESVSLLSKFLKGFSS